MNVFSGHGAPVTCGQFTPDGKTIVSGAEDGIVIVWDPKTAQPVRRHTPQDGRWHQEAVTCMAVNSDNTLLLTGSADGRAVLTNLTTGRLLSAFEGHEDSIEAVGFAPAMGLAATAATDGKLMLWDLATFRLRTTCKHDVGAVCCCSYGATVLIDAFTGRNNETPVPQRLPPRYHIVGRSFDSYVGFPDGPLRVHPFGPYGRYFGLCFDQGRQGLRDRMR